MWSAFMNGSGLHGGGGAGGGYVPSQGWEFVPCSRMDRPDRGRGKNRSPSRRISSPPTVFSHIYESQFSATGEGGAGTQLEVLRGQMWPGPDAQKQQQQQQPQQTQQTRLKKKLEDLKKRHIQDKEEWMREKESLLREVADIQGGENRRILLDLKTLQYTRDRCAWDLEKAELKCRIAQLEAREGAGLVSGGVQSVQVLDLWRHGVLESSRREEQRRLLADTHSAAMDLRCRLEHNERDWVREKAELLERFDLERREWECQLKDMQRKIEELYCDVGTKREESGLDIGKQQDDDAVHRLSIRSSSTGSSLLSDSEPLSSSSQSESITHPPLPSFSGNRNSSSEFVGRDGHHTSCLHADSLNKYVDAQFTQNDHSQPELLEELRYRGTWQKDSDYDSKKAVDIMELDAMFHGAPELSYGTEKKRNTTALNAALKEIARVSEELCSYQDEIRKKSGDKRTRSESLTLPEESDKLFSHDKTQLEVDDPPCDLSQIYDDFRALERENWITMSPDNTWRDDRGPSKSWRANSADPDSYRETQTSPELLFEIDTEAPTIPPRITSWIQSSPTHPDTELTSQNPPWPQ
ncbi:Microtubule cross-linking factor 1 [Dissostichus eleginoides]|uniref:Microtubule cross-linking factor 1 n=1 Tax=Dissostichus eleginoides TaxID=100907 RepID=A0AAD9C803_DISEL|nr:Microtubule cross-linking factor 1 [Dissostichus eleginoides]